MCAGVELDPPPLDEDVFSADDASVPEELLELLELLDALDELVFEDVPFDVLELDGEVELALLDEVGVPAAFVELEVFELPEVVDFGVAATAPVAATAACSIFSSSPCGAAFAFAWKSSMTARPASPQSVSSPEETATATFARRSSSASAVTSSASMRTR